MPRKEFAPRLCGPDRFKQDMRRLFECANCKSKSAHSSIGDARAEMLHFLSSCTGDHIHQQDVITDDVCLADGDVDADNMLLTMAFDQRRLLVPFDPRGQCNKQITNNCANTRPNKAKLEANRPNTAKSNTGAAKNKYK